MLETVVSALGRLFGGAVSSYGQHKANESNERIAREQNLYNAAALKYQNRFNLSMWKRQNEYNSPLAQRLRYEQAGINPALALGNITAGTAEGVTSAAAAPAAGADFRNSLSSLGDGIGSATQSGISAAQLKMSKDLNDAQVRNLDAQTIEQLSRNSYASDLAKNQVRKLEAEINAQNQETEFNAYNLELARREEPWKFAEWEAKIANIMSSTELNDMEKRLKKFDLEHLKPLEVNQAKASVMATAQYIKFLASQVSLNSEQAKYIAEQVLSETYRRLKLKVDSATSWKMLEPTIQHINAQSSMIRRQEKHIDHEETMAYWQFGADQVFRAVEAVIDVKTFGLKRSAQELADSFNHRRLEQGDRRLNQGDRRLNQNDRSHNWNVRKYEEGYTGKAPYRPKQ